MNTMPTVVTGLRTNAEYHLGNYLGALLPMVHLATSKSDTFQINLFAPDLHSFTTPIDHSGFLAQTLHNMKLFVACGLPIDHPNVFIYRQSHISAHAELTWILSCFTGFGEMSRMVEFKEKSNRLQEERVSVGLFTYPILMAADILLYNAEWVPVGEDQRQHLEFTRDIAIRFNNQFGEIFTVPKTITEQQAFVDRDAAPRIRSLRDPANKMSKSISDPGGTIQLSDNPEEARKKIMSATTDSVGVINYDFESQPGISNLLQILALLQHKTIEETTAEWRGKTTYGELKKAVADAVAVELEQIQMRMKSIDETALLRTIEQNEQTVNQIAQATLLRAQKAVGLR